MKKWVFIILAIVVIGGTIGYLYVKGGAKSPDTSYDSAKYAPTTIQPTGMKTITAITTGDKLLVAYANALKATSLSDTLDGKGPFTVLVPTESAFNAVPPDSLAMLLKIDNVAKLRNILTYHIIPGAITTSQLTNGQRLKTIYGQELTVELADGKVVFIDAKGERATIVKADVAASNGVIDTIDAVLLPQ